MTEVQNPNENVKVTITPMTGAFDFTSLINGGARFHMIEMDDKDIEDLKTKGEIGFGDDKNFFRITYKKPQEEIPPAVGSDEPTKS